MTRRTRPVAWFAMCLLAAACADVPPAITGSPRWDIVGLGAPNEPPGFRVVSERPFGALEEDGWIHGESSLFTVLTESEAPASPPTIGRAEFPVGFEGGQSAIVLERSFPGSPASYVSFWFRVSSRWQGHAAMNDVARLWIAGQPRFFWGFYGQDGDPLRSIAQVAGTPTPPDGARWLFANQGPAIDLTRDAWHRAEIVVRANTGGEANGQYHCWVDGQKVAEYTDIIFSGAGEGALWSIAHWAPGWGGLGDILLEPQSVDVDHLRLSTVPAWVHEPSGYQRIAEQSFESLSSWSWQTTFNDNNYVTVESAPDLPLSQPTVVQFAYPAGFVGGSAPGTVYRDFYPGTRRLYVGLWWKASENWQGHESGVNKIQFLLAYAGFGPMYMAMYGNPGGPYQLRVLPEFPGTFPVWLTPNVNNVPVTLGEWHHLEWLVDYQADHAHGTVRWWMDGQLIGDHADVTFPDAPLVQHQLSPTWGGIGGFKTHADFFWYDHVYLSQP